MEKMKVRLVFGVEQCNEQILTVFVLKEGHPLGRLCGFV
jgi:hypothetical protein